MSRVISAASDERRSSIPEHFVHEDENDDDQRCKDPVGINNDVGDVMILANGSVSDLALLRMSLFVMVGEHLWVETV